MPHRPPADPVSPLRLTASAILIASAVEVLVMFLLPLVPLAREGPLAEALTDGLLLGLLSAPLLWLAIVRPLRRAALADRELAARALDTIGEAVVTGDDRFAVLHANRAALRRFGGEEELAGVLVQVEEAETAARASGAPRMLELATSSGRRTFEASRVEWSGVRGTQRTVVLRDVTAREKRAMHERRLAAAVEQCGDAIEITGTDGRIVHVNPAWTRQTGIPLARAAGRPSERFLLAIADREAIEPLLEARRLGRAWSGRIDDADRRRTLSVSLAPIRDRRGALQGFVTVRRDITEWLEMERQLANSQKLEALGRLAAGVAHEINTPIQYVGDNLRFLGESLQDLTRLLDGLAEATHGEAPGIDTKALAQLLADADVDFLREELPRALEQSLEGVQRVAEIVRAMKEFSHPAKERVPTDLNRAVRTTVTVATNEWKYVAQVETDLDEALPSVPCVPGEIKQVLLNLIVNAAHAIGEKLGDAEGAKGTITVSTGREGEHAVLRVSDTGCGIPAEIRDKIFEPFFTTKEPGKGTGQGLALVHDVVVHKHGGTVEVDSIPGHGTTFTIRLPLGVDERDDEQSVAC